MFTQQIAYTKRFSEGAEKVLTLQSSRDQYILLGGEIGFSWPVSY